MITNNTKPQKIQLDLPLQQVIFTMQSPQFYQSNFRAAFYL